MHFRPTDATWSPAVTAPPTPPPTPTDPSATRPPTGRRSPMTTAEMVERHGRGESTRVIAAAAGIGQPAVVRRLAGRVTPHGNPGAPRRVGALDDDELLRRRRAGARWAQLAADAGLPRSTVQDHVRRMEAAERAATATQDAFSAGDPLKP